MAITAGTLFLIAALVFFILAGFSVTNSTGRVQCQWFAFACVVAAMLFGGAVLS